MMGVRRDGTVVVVGALLEGCEYDFDAWTSIVEAAVGYTHMVGLRADGTVVATGDNACGQCDVASWQDIVSISAGYFHMVGLNSYGLCVDAGAAVNANYDTDQWSDLIALSAGNSYTVDLQADGRLVALGQNGACSFHGILPENPLAVGLKQTAKLATCWRWSRADQPQPLIPDDVDQPACCFVKWG